MGLASYDIKVASASAVTVTAVMCSAPTYAVSEVRLVASPVFTSPALINGANYSPGQPLISAAGGVVVSALPLTVIGATTASVSSTTIGGVYSTAATTATFVVPFGTTFNESTKEYEPSGSPREYAYSASFITLSSGVTSVAETIIAGKVYVTIENKPRIPAAGTSSNKACVVTQA